MSESWIIFSHGKCIGTNGKYLHFDYAMTFDDSNVAKWLADYFDGTAIPISKFPDYESDYYKAVKEDVQRRLNED